MAKDGPPGGLMLDAPAKAQSGNHSSIVYFKFPDIHTAFEALSARGVAFEDRLGSLFYMPLSAARRPDRTACSSAW